ncbi:MAG: hypothetical protein ACYC4R_13260 [Anaerolineae bacterium]
MAEGTEQWILALSSIKEVTLFLLGILATLGVQVVMSRITERQTRQRWTFEKDSEILIELRSLCGHLTERLLGAQYEDKKALWEAHFPRIDALRGSPISIKACTRNLAAS